MFQPVSIPTLFLFLIVSTSISNVATFVSVTTTTSRRRTNINQRLSDFPRPPPWIVRVQPNDNDNNDKEMSILLQKQEQQQQQQQQEKTNKKKKKNGSLKNVNKKYKQQQSRSPTTTTTTTTSTTTTINTENTTVRPLRGGPEIIFEMIRKMLVFDDNTIDNHSNENANTNNRVLPRWRPTNSKGAISDNNPNFRTTAPTMNQKGYAQIIWRNARKRNKPVLWKHALRTYDRMVMESSRSPTTTTAAASFVTPCNIHHEGALLACAKLGDWEKAIQIYNHVEQQEETNVIVPVFMGGTTTPTTIMDPPTLTSTVTSRSSLSSSSNTSTNGNPSRMIKQRIQITDDMVYSLIKACVRGSKKLKKQYNDNHAKEAKISTRHQQLEQLKLIQQSCRIPLDFASEIIIQRIQNLSSSDTNTNTSPLLENDNHDNDDDDDDDEEEEEPDSTNRIRRKPKSSNTNNLLSFVIAQYINPLCYGYQNLGLFQEVEKLMSIQEFQDRWYGIPEEDESLPKKKKKKKKKHMASVSSSTSGRFNIYDISSKNKGSYTLLVTNHIITGNYSNAILALQNMTEEYGLYPNQRHLNLWTELSERKRNKQYRYIAKRT